MRAASLRLRRRRERRLSRKAPAIAACWTVVGKVVTFSETFPADVDGRVTPAGAGTLSDPGSDSQSTSEEASRR